LISRRTVLLAAAAACAQASRVLGADGVEVVGTDAPNAAGLGGGARSDMAGAAGNGGNAGATSVGGSGGASNMAGVGAGAAGPGANPAGAVAGSVLTASDVHVSDYPTVQALRWMGDMISRESGGALGIRVYHSGQLGRENDTVDLARFGALDITRINFASLNNTFPATEAMSLPYVFDSTEHMRRSVDGAAGRMVLDAFAKRGLVGLAIYDSGARCFYNHSRVVTEPGDLKGLKIRVPPSDMFVSLVRALGANPTPLSYGEIFSALQTKLIDGAENNWTTFQTSRHFEVARFWSQSEHSYSPEAVLMSKLRYDKLTSSQQELVRAAAAQSVPYMRTLWDSSEADARAAVEKAGIRATPVNRAAFQKVAAPIVESYMKDPQLQRIYQEIRAVA
jgi:tripartite ATP-independent transporter DctP family solute receptor